MKLKLAVILAAFFAFSVSSVQATDTGTPDILSSVSSGSVKTLSKEESADARGEYVKTIVNRRGDIVYRGLEFSTKALPRFRLENNRAVYRASLGKWGSFYVSR